MKNIIFDFDGTQTCAVTYGNGNRAELEGARPDFIINGFRGCQ